MHKRFEAQLTLGSTPIEQIIIPTKCRDEFPPFLRAMQHIYMDKGLNERIFKLLKSVICAKKRTGRQGMDLWTIFVLAGARLCLNADYDHLHYRSNHDSLLRQMLGIHDGMVRGREFDRQTIIDNVSLLDDDSCRKNNIFHIKSGRTIFSIRTAPQKEQSRRPNVLPACILEEQTAVFCFSHHVAGCIV